MSQNSDLTLHQQHVHEAHAHVGEHTHRDDVGSKMGMWLFLFTEVLLFGGMFILYASYRFMYSDAFKVAAEHLDTYVGAINTIILLASSCAVVLAIVSLQKKNKRLCLGFLWFTLACGAAFMVNKYFEWGHKIEIGIYPKGPALAEMSEGEVLFFGLYYVMTGLHGLHIIIGMIFIGVIMAMIQKNKITHDNFQKLENSGLYWHLVDVIWIFLFPLFYLIH